MSEQARFTYLLRTLPWLLAVTGLILMLMPTLVYDPGPASDTFAAIERRIIWGALLGAGLLLLAHHQLRPWRLTLANIAFWITLGITLARLTGLLLDGADSTRQWLWTGAEALVVLVAAGFIFKIKSNLRQ
ncbi:MAG: DUF4345 family protein [Pseudomonadales bacterium]|nr:DUF4345 family protein [Pseudomonadales bacterium]